MGEALENSGDTAMESPETMKEPFQVVGPKLVISDDTPMKKTVFDFNEKKVPGAYASVYLKNGTIQTIPVINTMRWEPMTLVRRPYIENDKPQTKLGVHALATSEDGRMLYVPIGNENDRPNEDDNLPKEIDLLIGNDVIRPEQVLMVEVLTLDGGSLVRVPKAYYQDVINGELYNVEQFIMQAPDKTSYIPARLEPTEQGDSYKLVPAEIVESKEELASADKDKPNGTEVLATVMNAAEVLAVAANEVVDPEPARQKMV